MKPENQRRILGAYQNFVDVPGFAAVIDMEAIDANEGNLTIARYVKPIKGGQAEEERKSLLDSWGEFDASGRAFWGDMDALTDMLDGIDTRGHHND